MARASPLRSGDVLAGLAAATGEERVAAQYALADLPLAAFLDHVVIAYEDDEVTRLIVDSHDADAFAPVAHLTVGGLRDWLLSDAATTAALTKLAPGLTSEMAAAVTKISRLQDLMVIAAKCSVVTRFRTTVGLPGRLAVPAAAEPSVGRPGRDRRQHPGWAAVGRGGRRDRHQSGQRQPGSHPCPAVHAGGSPHQARHPDPELRAGPCDDHAGTGAPRLPGGPDVPINRRDGGGEIAALASAWICWPRRRQRRCRWGAAGRR